MLKHATISFTLLVLTACSQIESVQKSSSMNPNSQLAYSGIQNTASNTIHIDQTWSVCPAMEKGNQDVENAFTKKLYDWRFFSIFEVHCEGSFEKTLESDNNYAIGWFHSVILFDNLSKTIKRLPLIAIDENYTKVVQVEDGCIIIANSPKDIVKNGIDILKIDAHWDTKKLGEIYPPNWWPVEIYSEWIAYFSWEFWDLHLFSFSWWNDVQIAKNTGYQFYSVHSDGASKVFGEWWNLLYYILPDGVGSFYKGNDPYIPKWVNVQFFVFQDWKSLNTLTMPSFTIIEGRSSWSQVELAFELTRTNGTVYFWPDSIQ